MYIYTDNIYLNKWYFWALMSSKMNFQSGPGLKFFMRPTVIAHSFLLGFTKRSSKTDILTYVPLLIDNNYRNRHVFLLSNSDLTFHLL